jgi:anti-sigma factor RsiW
MKRNLSNEHPEDTLLLAFMDAELPRATMRSTKQHLQACWKCRATLAELELQAQAVSKLLCQEDESDTVRAEKAKAKFLEKKSALEARTRRSVARFSRLLYSQPKHSTSGWFGQSFLETA